MPQEFERIADLRETIRTRAEKDYVGFSQLFPLEEMAAIAVADQQELYRKLSPKIELAVEAIEERFGPSGVEDCCRLLLAHLMYCWFSGNRHYSISERIGLRYLQDLDRLVSDIDGGAEPGRFGLYNDIYIKDLQCFTGRLFPGANAGVTSISERLPRSYAFMGGFKYWPGNCLLIAKLGGFDHFCGGHLHKPWFEQHGADGYWANLVLRAEVYMKFPELRGSAGSSWLTDPQVERISPRHAYSHENARRFQVRQIPIQTSESVINDAIAASPTRRKLYEEGKYIPQAYISVWTRDQAIAAGKYALDNGLAD